MPPNPPLNPLRPRLTMEFIEDTMDKLFPGLHYRTPLAAIGGTSTLTAKLWEFDLRITLVTIKSTPQDVEGTAIVHVKRGKETVIDVRVTQQESALDVLNQLREIIMGIAATLVRICEGFPEPRPEHDIPI